MIVSDALITLKALQSSDQNRSFLEKHKITTTDASRFIRLAEHAGTIESIDFSECNRPEVINKLAELKQMEAEGSLPYAPRS